MAAVERSPTGSRAAFIDPARLTGFERPIVAVRRRPLPRHGTDHDSKPLLSFPRFCSQHAHFSADKKSIEVVVRPRKGSAALPVLKKSRWLLLEREENLNTEQRFRLRDLLRYNLKTVHANLLLTNQRGGEPTALLRFQLQETPPLPHSIVPLFRTKSPVNPAGEASTGCPSVRRWQF